MFGQVETGTITAPAQSISYTFSATAGDVVNLTLVTTSGALVPRVRVYNAAGTLISSNYSGSPYGCSGSTLELNEVMLSTTGIYTVLIGDCSDTKTGTFVIYAQRTRNPVGASAVSMAVPQAGTISSAALSNTYTFTASANADVLFTITVTGGGMVPKIRVYDPAGKLIRSNYSGSPYGCSGSTVELNSVTIPVTGVYTVLVGDCGDTQTGTYQLYAQVTDGPAGAVTLLFGGTPQSGSIDKASQSSTYIFSANAGDTIEFTLVATSGALVPKIRLFDPAGTPIKSNYSGSPYGCSGATLEMNTGPLPATGRYTVLIGDCADTNTGKFVIYAQRTNKPTAAVTLSFAAAKNGLIASPAESDTYTFTGTATDVIDFTLATTTGAMVPKVRLYDPAGKLISSTYSGSPYGCSGPTLELNEVVLPANGTYTVLVGDCADKNTGNYAMFAQRTKNPVGPVALLWGEVQKGDIGVTAESDTFAFSGVANDKISLTMVTTSGSLVPKLRLYKPDGRLLASNYSGSPYGCSGSTLELGSVALPSTGKYTLLIGDCPDRNTGAYNLSSQCFGTCPPPNPAAATPVFSPPGGIYTSPQSVTITDMTPGAAIYYTTNGATPTTSSTRYNPLVPIPVRTSMTLKAIALASGYVQSAVATATYTIRAATPLFSPPGGIYTSPQAVRITDATPGATIYYTADNTTPTTASPKYNPLTPIPVAVTTTIKAIAAVPGYATSAVGTATYTIAVAVPIFSPSGGTYTSVQRVKIADATSGSTIHYTTDGSTPMISSPVYNPATTIAVSSTMTIKAIAVRTGFANSGVATATYILIGSPAALAAPATLITTSGATLNANVNTYGLTGSYAFQYGSSSTALTATSASKGLAASTATVPVSTPLTGLASKAKYYYRILVTTAGGTATGAVLSFTTN